MHPTTSRRSTSPKSPPAKEETFHMDYADEEGDELVLPADSLHGGSNLEERVQTTQNRLAQLREEAEALEQEKLRFEELSRQQKEFMNGRTEMGEKLTRALAHLDRETYEAQRRVEQLLVIKDNFNHHLDVIDSLNPEQWNPHDLRQDLARALGMIEAARDAYLKGSSQVHLLTSAPSAPASSPSPAVPSGNSLAEDSGFHRAGEPMRHLMASAASPPSSSPVLFNKETFRFWLFCGMGFSVPLVVTALLIFCAWLFFR